MKKIRLSILSTLLLTSMLSNVVFAAANNGVANNNTDLGKPKASEAQTAKPSVTLWALGGEQLIGSGQGLIPLGGDGVKSIFYGAVEAAGSFKKSNGYSAGVAAGYRRVINNSHILGGYLFVDYNHSPAGYNFLVANPGFEALGSVWDFRVNGYIPTNCQNWYGDETLAENLGITQFEKAFGHERYDHLFQQYEEVEPGFDAEVGRLIPLPKTHGLRAYVGAYHYFMDKTDNITGIEGRIVYPISKYISLEARDSYDKVRKNVFMGGIRLTFGGSNGADNDSLGIAGRLATPIEHNFGNFASANSVAVGSTYLDKGIEYHRPGSFWYFDNTSSSATQNNTSSGDGSYEHPFNAIDPRAYQLMTNSGAASQNIQMYVATGTSPYDLSDMPNHRLLLPYEDSIYGRTAHFTLAAKGAQRPELDGGITAFGGNNINDIQLKSVNQNFGNQGALFIFGPQYFNTVNINDVNINVSENITEASGISVMNSYATINNSQINVSSTGKSKQSFGIDLVNNAALFVGNNNFIHTTIASNIHGETNTAGIAGNSPVTIYGNNNQIIADAIGAEGHAIGIVTFNNYTQISGNNNYISANASGYDSRAGGIVNAGTTIISGNNNHIVGNASGVEGKALGIANTSIAEAFSFDTTHIANGNSQIIVSGNNNQIIGKSAESNSVGIVNYGGMVTILGNHNQISANSANCIAGHECNTGGIVNLVSGTTTISGWNNQITANSEGNAVGILDLIGGTTTISGNNNRIIANSATGEAIGIQDLGGMVTISGNNNQIFAATNGNNNEAAGIFSSGLATISGNNNRITANAAGYNSRAIGIFDANMVTISGSNNQITANSAYDAYGIYATSAALSVRNTIFNVSTTGGSEAVGISLKTLTDASNIILQGNTFNVSASGVNSNAYGIYLPNATTPAANGNIAFNVFNITNSATPSNAWGVYANSNWGSSAAWIRAHNIWINPTSATPQQQVYTNGAGFVSDYKLNTMSPLAEYFLPISKKKVSKATK